MCVNNLPRVALDSGEAGIRTHDLLIASVCLQAGYPSCCPTNTVRELKEKSIIFHGLSHSRLTWGLSILISDH